MPTHAIDHNDLPISDVVLKKDLNGLRESILNFYFLFEITLSIDFTAS